MKDLVIVGVGGHGREVLQCVADINADTRRWNLLGFVDDGATAAEVNGFPVVGRADWLRGRDCSVVVAIGAPAVRRRVVLALEAMGVTGFATLQHPSAQTGRSVSLGGGTMVCAGAILTTDIRVGRHVIVNTGAIVSHDAQLADFSTLAPRVCLSGSVSVGEGANLGAASTFLPGVTVGAWAVVGAAAAVIRDVAENETVVGVPARCIRARQSGWQDQNE